MAKLFRLILISTFLFHICICINCGVYAAEAQDGTKISSSTVESWFSYETLGGSLLQMPYRKAVIHGELPGLPALVVCLHGKSASGNNNTTQMKRKAVKNSAVYYYNINQKAIILAPQCPKGANWYNLNMLTSLRELIAAYEGVVDTKRIYIMGESAGGIGTWAMVSAYPQLFAAAMPVAANVKGEINQIQYTPLCVVVGEKDKRVAEAKVRTNIQQLQSLGAQIRYLVIPGASHSTVCSQAFTDENLSWVFSHTLGVVKATNPLEIMGKTAKVKYKKLKKKRKKLGRRKVMRYLRRGRGAMTFTKVKGHKKILVNKRTGKVTVKKGLKKGTYKVKVEVLAAGDSWHLASLTKKITFKIKVK